MKNMFNTIIGIIGGGIACIFGGWTTALTTLIILMLIDTLTGYIVAIVFKNSAKTETGTLNSTVGWVGLSRKCCTLLFVIIGYRLDITLGTSYLKDSICVGFMCNELISILENGGLMGIKMPQILTDSIDILKNKSVSKDVK